MPLYTDESGTPITTQSMIKTFMSCPREAYYKYHLGLQPKVSSLPLERGKWFHALLEDFYLEKDWEKTHQVYTSRFNKLFDEEKEKLGDLPQEIERLFKSYLWHYGDPAIKDRHWKVHEVELKLDAELPNGHIFRFKFDMLVEDDYGLWLVDHKTHKRFPDWDYRMLDIQSPMYIWGCRQNDIPVHGFIWNYIRTSGLTPPKVLKDGKKFYSKDMINETDYVTFAKGVKAAQEEHPEFLSNREDKKAVKERLAYLKSLRWDPNKAIQDHPFFRRDIIEKSDELIDRVVRQQTRTSDRMHSYDFSDPDLVERNINACKSFMCSYKNLNMGDLLNGDSTISQQRDYVKRDPLAYQDGDDGLGGAK